MPPLWLAGLEAEVELFYRPPPKAWFVVRATVTANGPIPHLEDEPVATGWKPSGVPGEGLVRVAGISHAPEEHTADEDIMNGTQVLLRTLLALDERGL